MNRNLRERSGICALAVACVVLSMSVASETVQAGDDDNDRGLVFPPGAKISGSTYREWTAKWWQYIFPIPSPANPTNDTAGNFCDVAQRGPVWFLAGSGSGVPVTRTCTIHAREKPIFFPIINVECSTQDQPPVSYPNGFHCTDGSSCTTCATLWGALLDSNSLKATVDGQEVTALNKFHFQSPPFEFRLPGNNILGTGRPGAGTSVSDGYWLMLKPLRPGHHTLHFEGALPSASFTVNVTYELTVAP